MFPWANFVKSIEGEYSITAAETRYRFVWDRQFMQQHYQKILVIKKLIRK